MSALARYRVLKRLGAGAAGSVYLVEDRILGGPPVALKRVDTSSDPSFRDSFAREFAVLASLALPGVARVHDLGVMPADGDVPAGPFFTRSYVDGEPLDTYAARRGAEDSAALVLRVLQTVAQLHRRGIVHGDLKPANIIVDGAGAPWVIDFGLASRGAEAERLRGSGTPGYMAPELFRGGAPSVSADIYALGATLWAVIAGHAPLEDLGERAIAAKLRGELPQVPREVDGVARGILEAALWALADDPRDRAPSADELAARLERAMGRAARTRSAARGRGFVPPRARGRDALYAELEARVRGDRASPIVLVVGARGMGKSSLLCELKWRLQLEGAPVVEVRCTSGGLDPLLQILRQAVVLRSGDHSRLRALIEKADAGAATRDELVQGVVEALSNDVGHKPLIVLVDDLDQAESLLTEALRMAVHGDARVPPVVLASAERADVAPLDSLGAEVVSLTALDAADARRIIGECLGPIDAAAEDALLAHAAGNPGVLVEALATLAAREGLTAHDVAQLEPGEIGASLARAKLEGAPVATRRLAAALSAAAGVLPVAFVTAWLGAEAEDSCRELVRRGLARLDQRSLVLLDGSVLEWLRGREGREGAREVARELLSRAQDAELDAVRTAELALVAGDKSQLLAVAESAFRTHVASGAHAAAARVYEASLAQVAGARARDMRLALAELYGAMGDTARAAEHAERVLDGDAPPVERARALVAAGRAYVAAGRLDRAIELLSTVPDAAPAWLRAQAARELARVHYRRGDSELAKVAVERGLDVAAGDDPSRAELLAIDGLLASMRGERERAHARYDLAVEAAQRSGNARDEAQALGYRAFACEREGELERAREEYQRCLTAARASGDIGMTAQYASNLGNVSFRVGRIEGAEEHYTLAARLSRRAGRVSTALLAENNLAHLHLYLGTYARARSLAEASFAEAERLGVEIAQAHALQILADLDARTHDTESALARYEAAANRYKKLGRTRELAEVWLDAAEALLDRGSVSDGSAAAAKLAAARDLVDKQRIDDFRVRLRLLLSRARAHNGDVEGAAQDLERIEAQPDAVLDRDLRWQIAAAQATMYRSLGSEVLAAKKAREAAEAIEKTAATLPRDAREPFRKDPRRRAVLEAAAAREQSSPSAHTIMGSQTTAFVDRRFDRLLEIIKRLAREHDLDRLLERITDAAVELSGAERGFVLLVDDDGQLSTHTVRASGGAVEDPHVAFSRSIAEAVLIDGEPILTVNARDDRRVNEFMSVHKLMLKSVACIPINGPNETVGVLYLEHRLRAGRFQESDLDLLVAFGDQAAIALENARLWAENAARNAELEQKNRALADAKAEMERLLVARTEELDEARRDLGRARAELEGQHKKHGIVGQSAVMRRVFALIERVQDTHVPVVIQGESGTGKELVARAIHFGGARKKAPFVAINCAALPDQLLESELFGHVRGAFTGADRDKKGLFVQAQGGTLFLDEFADMPMRMQIDLLRVLQDGKIRPVGADEEIPVDVRVIAAANRPLMQLVAERKLREDLYYRLSVVEVRLPALRERVEDIPLLCDHLLTRMAQSAGNKPRRLSREALERIIASGLPGNVRQLEHILLSAAMMAEGPIIEAHDLPLEGQEPAPSQRPLAVHGVASPAPSSVLGPDVPTDVNAHKQREKQRILEALESCGWNRAKAAEALNIPRRTFYRRLTEFGIL